ncbi:hypothetical protein NDU88_005433 [Pleurodeles waltl]|uniref:Uncharacterized protein n=1 Tax=Pleurodeles waltl TaxID=8319 RepID=A0AAV7PI30_PLEWA|nr:hypothetical protein NDU88_005433 [Pleurodeles waltl]
MERAYRVTKSHDSGRGQGRQDGSRTLRVLRTPPSSALKRCAVRRPILPQSGRTSVRRSGEVEGGPTLPGARVGVLVGLRHLQQWERPGHGLAGGGGPRSDLIRCGRWAAERARAQPSRGHRPPCHGWCRIGGREKKRCTGPPVWGLCAALRPRASETEVESVPPGLVTADGGLSLRECFSPSPWELGPRSGASLRLAEGECPARRPRWRSGAGAPVPPKVRSESGGGAAGATTGGRRCHDRGPVPQPGPEGEVGEAVETRFLLRDWRW